MTIESAVADLTTATNSLTSAVAIQQGDIEDAVALFADTTSTVDNDLNNVNNTADADKPVSTPQATALGLKQDSLVSGVNLSTVNGVSLLDGEALVIARSPTSLSFLAYADRRTLSVDPVHPNLPNVLDDSVIVEGLGMFMWVDTTTEPNDDETCFTTPSGQWLLRTPAIDLLSAYSLIEHAIVEEFIEDQLAAQA
jgi:hypothetical protein